MNRWRATVWHTPYRHWLTAPGSLTRRLVDRCPGFNVVRLRQEADRPYRDEAEEIGLPPGQRALTREVLLRCGDTPLVFAHSVLPLQGLAGPWRALARLGNRPLAATLFTDPRIARHPLEFRRLDARHPLYRAAARHWTAAPRVLWARRSRFIREGQPLLVTEVFLPAVLSLLPPTLTP